MLQGKHITFSYSDSAKGKIDVLKDVSFEIREHDFIGLIGTSGSGKTTLIKHLNGLLKAESGEIFFNGENIYSKKYPISKLRKEVGLVFQYPEQQLFGRTILKDVMYGPLNLGMSEEEAEKSAVESLELVGCHPCVNTSSLSFRVRDLIDVFLPAVGHSYITVRLSEEA